MRTILASVCGLGLAVAAANGAQAGVPLPDPAQAAPQMAPAPQGKLVQPVRPRAYRLDLTVDPAKERFSGQVEIDSDLGAASSFINLHGRNLTVRHAAARVAGRTIAGTWTQRSDTGAARLVFPEALPAGPVTLVFDYDAAFNEAPAGMFRVKVGEDWYSWTQFESIDARAAFPGFDEPGFKTPFTVTLRTPPGLTAVSNSREISRTTENGLEVHRFEPTLPLPTYLVAMMAGPFAVAESTAPPSPQRSAPLPLRIISTRQNAGKLAYALEGSKAIVAHLEDYFGQPFPFPKLDQITTPILPGAMENAGADLYSDEILVLDEKADVQHRRDFGMVVSHELAHQWFGDLVTPAWWDDIWLNESFANWMGYRIGDAWRPDLKIASGATAEGFAAMNTDALLAGRPIRQKIETDSQIDGAFDSITYGKGGHVVAMIAAFMGDARFRDGVRRYMAAHSRGNATSTDFFAALAEAAGDPQIVPAMQSFTDQQGVPLLTFARKGKGWEVRQSRYVRLGTTAPPVRWGVPMCLRRGDARQCSLLTGDSAAVEIGGKGPLMPNAGGTGYYRFDLPRRDWQALIAEAGRLPGGEAQALSDSLMASFRAGHSDLGQLLGLARKLLRNPDSHAGEAAANIFDWLGQSELIDDAVMPAYRAWLGKLYRPAIRRLGFDPRAGAYAADEPERAQARALAVGQLAAASRDRDLRKELAEAAARYIGGDAGALDPAWYERALAAWLTGTGIDGARQLSKLALASQDPVFRPAALQALAASGDKAIAKWLLEDFRDPRLRLSEQRRLLAGITMTRTTRELGYDWFKANLTRVLSGDGGIFFAARVPQMLNGFCSAERAERFARDLRGPLGPTPGALELERTIERVRNCGLLRAARGVEVSGEVAGLH